ncbi:MAG TPA: DUF4123 domain-containing protein [Acidiphilium sp.]|nr:MAG: hypothetical protein B7Z67_09045 [Acidiphilium sp. 21-60-14]OZB39421.1 MAG: hypothetical protein B7X48_08905 [Acidiphilium sp. 34-60-192]HQT88251.1 DUF4123 domain-containing protein [Acidiphilium sp.]HQU23457.1 DUF4123 domain-containing protein [Acidiphilium sp.]
MLVDSTFNRALPNDLFAVLDPARDPIVFDTMTVLAPDAQCLFGGELADAVRRGSPHVMAMPQPGLLLDWWRQNGRGKSYGIACRGDVGMQALRLHLKTLLRVRLPDGRLVLFRFWDPRVLETFIKNSTPLEQARLFGPIRTFYGESPEGRSIAWDRPEGIEVPARSEMQISPRLYEAFTRADLFSRLLAFLLERGRRPEFRAFLERRDAAASIWDRIWPKLRELPEYLVVITLTYGLLFDAGFLKTDGHTTDELIARCLGAAQPDYPMKVAIEESGMLRFSEFDL